MSFSISYNIRIFKGENRITLDVLQWDFFNEVITTEMEMILLKRIFMFVGIKNFSRQSCQPFLTTLEYLLNAQMKYHTIVETNYLKSAT